LEQFEGGFESSAARSYQGDFVYDHGGGVYGHFTVDGRFQDHRAARLSHTYGCSEAGRRTGRIHYPFVFGLREMFAPDFDGDACSLGYSELFAMTPELVHAAAAGLQSLGDQEAEFAIAEDGDLAAFWDRDLIEDFAGCAEGFGKHRGFGWDEIRNYVEIAFGQREEFAEGAGVLYDAENSAVGAMASESALAPGAVGTRQVDFAYDSFASECWRVAFDNFADKFMAWGAQEAVVSALEFEIGVADASYQEADEGEGLGPFRGSYLLDRYAARVEVDRQHQTAVATALRAAIMPLMRAATASIWVRASGSESATFCS